jgi:hypothetical protein
MIDQAILPTGTREAILLGGVGNAVKGENDAVEREFASREAAGESWYEVKKAFKSHSHIFLPGDAWCPQEGDKHNGSVAKHMCTPLAEEAPAEPEAALLSP